MDIVYIHSPITYSIAEKLISQGTIRDPLMVCGRGTEWCGPHVKVVDDGIWDLERTVEFLVQLESVLPTPQAHLYLNLYLPHSGYLLGKLLKLSPAVSGISYIEEGNTSCNALLASDSQDQKIDTSMLLRLLQSHPSVMETLKLTASQIHRVNLESCIWFDGHTPKYRGAYRVSPDAFPTLGNVSTVTLNPQYVLPATERNWLCFLPNIINMAAQHGANSVAMQKLFHSLIIALRTMSAMIKAQQGRLILKFHPVDHANLNPVFKSEIFKFGQNYQDFALERGLDTQLEPTLFNFDHFIVINESAAIRYVKLFHKSERLMDLNLD